MPMISSMRAKLPGFGSYKKQNDDGPPPEKVTVTRGGVPISSPETVGTVESPAADDKAKRSKRSKHMAAMSAKNRLSVKSAIKNRKARKAAKTAKTVTAPKVASKSESKVESTTAAGSTVISHHVEYMQHKTLDDFLTDLRYAENNRKRIERLRAEDEKRQEHGDSPTTSATSDASTVNASFFFPTTIVDDLCACPIECEDPEQSFAYDADKSVATRSVRFCGIDDVYEEEPARGVSSRKAKASKKKTVWSDDSTLGSYVATDSFDLTQLIAKQQKSKQKKQKQKKEDQKKRQKKVLEIQKNNDNSLLSIDDVENPSDASFASNATGFSTNTWISFSEIARKAKPIEDVEEEKEVEVAKVAKVKVAKVATVSVPRNPKPNPKAATTKRCFRSDKSWIKKSNGSWIKRSKSKDESVGKDENGTAAPSAENPDRRRSGRRRTSSVGTDVGQGCAEFEPLVEEFVHDFKYVASKLKPSMVDLEVLTDGVFSTVDDLIVVAEDVGLLSAPKYDPVEVKSLKRSSGKVVRQAMRGE